MLCQPHPLRHLNQKYSNLLNHFPIGANSLLQKFYQVLQFLIPATDTSSQYTRMETIINQIHHMGREQYKRRFKTGAVDNDLQFCSIRRQHVTGEQGFAEWQRFLSARLV